MPCSGLYIHVSGQINKCFYLFIFSGKCCTFEFVPSIFYIDRGGAWARFELKSYLEWCLLTLYDIVLYLFNSEIQDVIITLCQAQLYHGLASAQPLELILAFLENAFDSPRPAVARCTSIAEAALSLALQGKTHLIYFWGKPRQAAWRRPSQAGSQIHKQHSQNSTIFI